MDIFISGIEETKEYKGLYYLKYSDGTLSKDFYNLTRAKALQNFGDTGYCLQDLTTPADEKPRKRTPAKKKERNVGKLRKKQTGKK